MRRERRTQENAISKEWENKVPQKLTEGPSGRGGDGKTEPAHAAEFFFSVVTFSDD